MPPNALWLGECTKDSDSGTAQCQVDITYDEVCYHLKFLIDMRMKIKELAA